MIIKKSLSQLSQERFCTWPRFKTEACGISEMVYLIVLVDLPLQLELTYHKAIDKTTVSDFIESELKVSSSI